MRRELLLCLFLVCCAHLVAQTPAPASSPSYSPEQCTIGFYTRDSVAIQLPGTKPHYDVINSSNKSLYYIREKLVIATDHWLTVKDDSMKKSNEQQAALEHVVELQADSLIEVMQIQNAYEKLKPAYAKIDHVADSIGKSRKLKQVRDVGDNSEMICPPDQMLMIDITNDIAIAMHVKPKLLKIGVCNSDSLLRLMPGYAVLDDSSDMEMMALKIDLAVKQMLIDDKQIELDTMRKEWSRKQINNREKEIAELQDEYDTYRGYETYKLDVRDSIRKQEYKKKFRVALAAAVKEQGCFRVYDMRDPHQDWTAKEAEFIDLNPTLAGKLGLPAGK